MTLKKTLAMLFVLSLLVAAGIMQISAQNKNAVNNSAQVSQAISEPSEEEISTKTPDLDNIEEEFEGQDIDDESEALEANEEKGTEVENDGIVHEFEGEEEHQD